MAELPVKRTLLARSSTSVYSPTHVGYRGGDNHNPTSASVNSLFSLPTTTLTPNTNTNTDRASYYNSATGSDRDFSSTGGKRFRPHSPRRLMSWRISISNLFSSADRHPVRRLPEYAYTRLGNAATVTSSRRKKQLLAVLSCGFLALVVWLYVMPGPYPEWMFWRYPNTLVFQKPELRQIWRWEIESGHYPSRAPIPTYIGFNSPPKNPALNAWEYSPHGDPKGPVFTGTLPEGPERNYLTIQRDHNSISYPPRLPAGSIADLDVVMGHCDFSHHKYVRDCLEVLRVGAGLDGSVRLRQNVKDWRYIYTESPSQLRLSTAAPVKMDEDSEEQLGVKLQNRSYETLDLPPIEAYHIAGSLEASCDDNPRIFHMFWAGPFTDKPYMALLSWLYTQNTGIHLHQGAFESTVCRPVMWVWINPGPAAAVPNPTAESEMYDELNKSPWSQPFLHPRFGDVIQFKLWNTTEQLDGIPELKDEWRSMQQYLFSSEGVVFDVKKKNGSPDNMANRTGSKSATKKDKLSTVLSDMVRFVACHRYGGIYVDADTIFLRDWTDLWGWHGAFAYRWSRLNRYNTAVLHMNKGSAFGSWLFRTALHNKLDFHPITIGRYLRDAHMEHLLLRLPSALFDSAWLVSENLELDRPPQPLFRDFEEFFDTPAADAAVPNALGFDGFFKGAYSYHFHNFWWKPTDPLRNWPDLGQRFAEGERIARAAAGVSPQGYPPDKQDLAWSSVLKRTFEAYIRGEIPNMYGEWIAWDS